MITRLEPVIRGAPVLMVLALFVASVTHLTDDPHAAGLVLVFYIIAWVMAPKTSTVIAVSTAGYVFGRLIY